MRLRFLACLVFAGLLSTVPLDAQMQSLPVIVPPAPQPAGYPVVGRVTCADTQRPARFAQVMLLPVSTAAGDNDRGRMVSGRTDLDGRFSIGNVPPGDYYATAEMAGYINEAGPVRLAQGQGGDAVNALSSVPRVQVTTGGGSVQLSLQRGGVLSGAVQWDDGSPAAGVQVTAQAPAAQGGLQDGQALQRTFFPAFGNTGQTDDRGRFRLSGLAPGSYVLRASVQSPMPAASGGEQGRFGRLVSLNVYAPNKLRKTDAAVIPLAAGEERSDVNVVLGLSGMHVISGQVSSSSVQVRSGSVQVVDQTDSTLSRRGSIASDGTFTVPYVPPGTYTLRVSASTQAVGAGRGGASGTSDAAVRFQPLQESVTVTDGDLTGLNLTVTPSTGAQ